MSELEESSSIHHIAMLDVFFAMVEPDRDRLGEEVALRLPMIVFRNRGSLRAFVCKCLRGSGDDS